MTHIETTLILHRQVFTTAEDILIKDIGTTLSMGFPTLFAKITARLGLDMGQIGRMQQPVRDFIHTHPNWKVVSGHNGGIISKELWLARQATKQHKKDVRAEVMAMIETKLEGDTQ